MVVGQLVYGVYILGLPLGLLHLTLRWVSSTTCTWGTHMNIPVPVVHELKVVCAVLLANPWTYVDTSGAPPAAMLSADASPTGGAVSVLTPTYHLTWAWNWDIPPEHQVHREAWATTIGLALAQAHLPTGSLARVSNCVPWMFILSKWLFPVTYITKVSHLLLLPMGRTEAQCATSVQCVKAASVQCGVVTQRRSLSLVCNEIWQLVRSRVGN